MEFGVCLSNYGKTLDLETLRLTAQEAEKLGFSSIWLTDHILMPADSGTHYGRILETLTTLGYLSAVTKKVKIGISSLIIAMRNPVVVTKQLATLDYLSGGRLVTAIAAGWNEAEFTNMGSNFHDRGKRVDETIRLIRTLWRGETRFESDKIPQHFESVEFEPRPVQKDLFIWIGGNSKFAMKRAANFGDGWHADGSPPEAFRKLVKEFRSVPGTENKKISTRLAFNSKATQTFYKGAKGDDQLMLSSNFSEDRGVLDEFSSLGVSEAMVEIDYNGATPLDGQLENLRTFAKEFLRAPERGMKYD